MSSSPTITCDRTSLARIIDLRHVVLRPGLPRDSAKFPGDEDPTTQHFAAFSGDQVIACASFMLNAWENEPAWQLRGMAVRTGMTGRGVGSTLLRFAEITMLETSATRLFWCNARTAAMRFYSKHGWAVVSEPFNVEGVGPHVKMIKRIES